ncbi:MAG: response regulator transcription factor [Flavobacteriaceae bacterium]|nr:response regulator transcription factor [Bacteroidia bacterium]MBT8288874.1 response regulator transcription factor [Bacteroidia bacterium]NNF74397.1 response regulator transcription factor [Flavobacteriaceae bacterium]NNK72558.1 response regulator transcription factor [Flavobacteriaceae bacterium]
MKRTILIFSALILSLLVLFQLGKYGMMSGDITLEFIISTIAIVFFLIGIYINKRTLAKRTNEITDIDHSKIKALDISDREYEVLILIAEGLSNREIADRLFLTESTIKTHVSNLLLKLGAKRRTQAIQMAKAENIL